MKKILIITILLTSTIWSCGSRKTSKSKAEEKFETKIEASADTSIKSDKEINNNIQKQNNVVAESDKKTENNIIEQKQNLEPVDPSKPMVKETKKEGNTITETYHNAKVVNHNKTDNSTSEEKSKVTDNSLFNDKSKTKDVLDFDQNLNYESEDKGSSVTENKDTHAQRGFSLWWLLLLIMPAGFYAYWKWKK